MRAIRMISTEIYEPRGTEAYLEEMERKGYHLDAAGKLLFYFKRTEPQDMRYRVEYWQDELPGELIAQYKDCGWEYVAETQRHVYIFRAPAGTPLPEPYDWEQRCNQYRRYMCTAVWLNLVLAVIVLAVITGLCIWAGVEAYFDPKGSWWLTITTAALILACVYTVFQVVHARQYWRSLGKTEHTNSRCLYRMGCWLAILGVVVYLGALGAQFANLFQQSVHDPANFVPLTQMSEQLDAKDLPYFTLEDLGRPDGETWEQMSGVYPHQPLTRTQYSWYIMTPYADKEQRLRLDYYEVSLPLLDRALLASIRSDDMERIETDRFDTLYRDAEENYLRMTARLGRKVIDMSYTGNNRDKAEALFYETFGR